VSKLLEQIENLLKLRICFSKIRKADLLYIRIMEEN